MQETLNGTFALVRFETCCGQAEAFNVAFTGRKRWFMVPAPQSFWSRKPIIQWFREWLHEGLHENLADYSTHGVPPMFQCIQEAGDIMYVPENYGHAVLNLEDSVAVAAEMVPKEAWEDRMI